MLRTLSPSDVRRLRTRSQCLDGPRPTDVSALLQRVCALQAQDTRACRLAVRPRSEGLGALAVIRAGNEERAVVRTWAMRGTLHMLPAEDVGWIVALLGTTFAASDRRRRLQLGLDDDLCARALPAIRDILSGGHALTRAELVRSLAAVGIPIDPHSQAPAHLVGLAALRGLICRGPDRADDEPTYVLLEEWVGAAQAQMALEPEEALAELARRYLRAYAPAGVRDFASWAGIALGQAQRGFEQLGAEIEAVDMAGEEGCVLAGAPLDLPDTDPCVRLLPLFDAYLLGYRSRDLALAPRFARQVQAGGGWIHPTAAVDGRIVGTWRLRRAKASLTVAVQPFEPLDRSLLPLLEAEAADVGRFLQAEATLTIEG